MSTLEGSVLVNTPCCFTTVEMWQGDFRSQSCPTLNSAHSQMWGGAAPLRLIGLSPHPPSWLWACIKQISLLGRFFKTSLAKPFASGRELIPPHDPAVLPARQNMDVHMGMHIGKFTPVKVRQCGCMVVIHTK